MKKWLFMRKLINNEMLIQPILFPPEYLKNEPELFFRGICAQNISDRKVSIPAGSTLSLETYFNAFSIGKWIKYTKLDHLSLCLEIEGDVEIKAYHAVGAVNSEFLSGGMVGLSTEEYHKIVNSQAYSATREEASYSVVRDGDCYTVKFDKLYKNGIVYVAVQANTDAIIYGGGYESVVDEKTLSKVKLAVGICTFKREEEVTRNINCILDKIILNTESPLYDKLEVYVADNGQTLDKESFNGDKIHLFSNPNLGGAGGFARTMIEAMVYDKAKDFTHLILMDDDIILYPAVLERTYYLLLLLKPEYHKAILGAGMFLDDQTSVQQEIGAEYRDSVTWIGRANHKFFDMRNPDAVSANEVINKTNYTGWWFACIPKAVATTDNLPMPYFIHYDDAEYGLRNVKNGQLFINGVCVWHPAPANKGPLWIAYYNVRNRLITMFSYSLSLKGLVKYIWANTKIFLFHITRYEYSKATLMLQALQDFLKGPEVFIKQDAFELHNKLAGNKITYITPEQAGVDRKAIVNRHHKNFLIAGIEQLFCNLLPAKDSVKAVDGRYFTIPYRAKNLYIYDMKSDKGYILERNQKAFFKLLFGYNWATLKLLCRYKPLLHDWQEAKPTLTSLSFWENYLGLSYKE